MVTRSSEYDMYPRGGLIEGASVRHGDGDALRYSRAACSFAVYG
jgi:hypothetical protein